MRYDTIIVGGGPIGSFIAQKLGKSGFSVALLEEHREAGLPVQCAGLVTTKLEKLTDLSGSIVNTVEGAHIYSPKGHCLKLETGRPKAHVIDRTIFDSELLSKASDSGAEIELGTRLTGLKRVMGKNKEELELSVSMQRNNSVKTLRTSLLIGADGANSRIRSLAGFPEPALKLRGFGMEFEYDDIPQNIVQIFSGNNIAPGFFAWIIPAGHSVRAGLCINGKSGNLQDYFKNFLKISRDKGLLPDGKPLRTISGTIPLGILTKTTDSNIMLVGDSAAHVKPTSGGGIYPGLKCALQCSKIAAEALEAADLSNENLMRYHKSWHDLIGMELERGLRLYNTFMQLSDDKLEEAFDILDKPEIIDAITRKGDIESPFALAKLLFKKAPKLIKFAGPYFRSAFK